MGVRRLLCIRMLGIPLASRARLNRSVRNSNVVSGRVLRPNAKPWKLVMLSPVNRFRQTWIPPMRPVDKLYNVRVTLCVRLVIRCLLMLLDALFAVRRNRVSNWMLRSIWMVRRLKLCARKLGGPLGAYVRRLAVRLRTPRNVIRRTLKVRLRRLLVCAKCRILVLVIGDIMC